MRSTFLSVFSVAVLSILRLSGCGDDSSSNDNGSKGGSTNQGGGAGDPSGGSAGSGAGGTGTGGSTAGMGGDSQAGMGGDSQAGMGGDSQAGMGGDDNPGDITMVTVPGTANIFGAGHAVPPAPGGLGGGVLPILVDLPIGTDRTLTVTGVSGSVDYDGTGSIPENGADGGVFYTMPVTSSSFGGIAGLSSDRGRFLSGCFLDDSEPADPAPTPYDVDATAPVVDGIALGQTVFVGDGLNGSTEGTGVVQVFRIPDAATRLFLGFLDYPGTEADPPGGYGNNTGELTVTVTVLP